MTYDTVVKELPHSEIESLRQMNIYNNCAVLFGCQSVRVTGLLSGCGVGSVSEATQEDFHYSETNLADMNIEMFFESVVETIN